MRCSIIFANKIIFTFHRKLFTELIKACSFLRLYLNNNHSIKLQNEKKTEMSFKPKVEDYTLGRTMGEGAFGKVKSKYFENFSKNVLTPFPASFYSRSE